MAHNSQPLKFWATCLGLALAAPAWAASNYQITVLDTLSGYNGSVATSINNQGTVLGNALMADGSYQAFTYGLGGTLQGLGAVAGGYSWGADINDSGVIVGTLYERATAGVRMSAYQSTGSGYTTLAGLSSVTGLNSTASAINNQGQIVGSYKGQAAFFGPASPVALSGSRYDTQLGQLEIRTSPSGELLTINNKGQVGGQATPYQSWQTVVNVAVLGDLDSMVMTTIPGSSLANPGRVSGMNDAGVGVGHVSRGVLVPKLFTATGEQTLTGLAGYNQAYATGINNAGLIVGSALSCFPPTLTSDCERGVIWENGVAIDVNTLLVGQPASAWTVVKLNGLNESGQLVGAAVSNGVMRGVVLTPVPEPASAVMLLVGLVGLAGLKSRKG